MNENTTILLLVIALVLGGIILYLPVEDTQPNSGWRDQGWNQQREQGWNNPFPIMPERKPERPTPPENIKPTNYQHAVSLAKAQNKNLLLFFQSQSCGYCTQMKKQTMSDRNVQNAMNDFVFYEVNTSRESSVTRHYGVNRIPAYLIVSPNEEVKKVGQGMRSPNEFIRWLN